LDAWTFAGVAARACARAEAVAALEGCAPKQYMCAPCDAMIFLSFNA
jgi:hypothetical protein